MKKTFIKYYPPYGGQAFKKKGILNGFEAIKAFTLSCTDSPSILSAELKIFEGKQNNKYDYSSSAYLEKAIGRFGKAERQLSISNIHYKDDDEYSYNWRLSNEQVFNCIELLESISPLPKYFINPITMMIYHNFHWIDEYGELVRYQEDEFINTFMNKSRFLLFLSNNNSIIMDFIFPFNTISGGFKILYDNIQNNLPVDLNMNKMRLYIPNKKQDRYIIRKINS